MPDALREVSPTLHQLRSWHRSQDLPPVIDALSPHRAAISPREKALLALALAMKKSEKKGTDLFFCPKKHKPWTIATTPCPAGMPLSRQCRQ
jgi:hypothetical protein